MRNLHQAAPTKAAADRTVAFEKCPSLCKRQELMLCEVILLAGAIGFTLRALGTVSPFG